MRCVSKNNRNYLSVCIIFRHQPSAVIPSIPTDGREKRNKIERRRRPLCELLLNNGIEEIEKKRENKNEIKIHGFVDKRIILTVRYFVSG